MLFNKLHIKKGGDKSSADGTLLMLLSLNFLLLAFFILLNSLATKEAGHAKTVLARVREGYNVQGPLADGDGRGTSPVVAKAAWQGPLASRLQGVVLNRLNLQTIPLQADADKLVMVLPADSLFSGASLHNAPLVRNIVAAAGSDATLRWDLLGPWRDHQLLAARAAALVAETGKVNMMDGTPAVRITFTPGAASRPGVGGTLQMLGIEGGASRVEGVHDEQP